MRDFSYFSGMPAATDVFRLLCERAPWCTLLTFLTSPVLLLFESALLLSLILFDVAVSCYEIFLFLVRGVVDLYGL